MKGQFLPYSDENPTRGTPYLTYSSTRKQSGYYFLVNYTW